MRLHTHLRLWLPSLLPLADTSDISDDFPSPSPFFPSSLTAFWTGSPLSQASRGLITAVHRKRPSGITTHVIQTIVSRARSALTLGTISTFQHVHVQLHTSHVSALELRHNYVIMHGRVARSSCHSAIPLP